MYTDRLLRGAAILATLCAVAAVGLSIVNQPLRLQVNARTQMISEGTQLGFATPVLLNALRQFAERTHDDRLREVVVAHGTVVAPAQTSAERSK
jgi:hypothetical protein